MKEVMINSFQLGDPGGDDKQLFLFKAPSDALGGGITVVGGAVVNGAALTEGTVFTLALHKYSSAGTPAVNGTIAPAIGTTGWADAVPIPFVVTHTFVDAGEWVVLDYQEIATGSPTNCMVEIHYVMGK